MARGAFVLMITLLALAASSAVAHGARSHRNRRPHHEADRHRRAGWSCPIVADAERWPELSCQCDLAHTLRCTSASASADPSGAEKQVAAIVGTLRMQPRERFVSLLDLSIRNLSRLAPFAFDAVTLHGLVVTSGEIVDVSPDAFSGLGSTLTALGLPNNRLTSVPELKSLKHLERLDLSNNKIRAIVGDPFGALERLRLLDLSGNGLETLGAGVFRAPSPLRSLHLGSNRLDASQLDGGALAGLNKLQEIDLSANRLRGRLTSSFLQGLDSLVTLDLTANNLTLLKRGMLSGLRRLHTLRLARNQIDVIEDQSFVALTSLTALDLSHNGVVAISGQSLSHLDNLSQLDLGHNYLRAVTADLVNGLPRLESLDLTDNDISSVEPGVLGRLPKLVHLLLTDNPLNCDCHSLELAAWLRNGTGVESNRKTAACATPPALENALLYETDPALLTCEPAQMTQQQHSDEDTEEGSSGSSHFLSSQPTEDFIRLSSAQVQFVSAELEGSSLLHTVWTVDAATLPYSCDAVLVYELSEEHEALLDSYPVRCHSEERPNKDLRLTVKLGDNMKPDGQYRLCLVLFEGGHDDEASLLPGCSHSMTWQALRRIHDYSDEVDQVDAFEASPTQITAFYANVSSSRSVSVYMRILDAAHDCQFTVVVFQSHRLLARKQLNCSATSFTFGQMAALHDANDDPILPTVEYSTGEYQVCATFDRHGEFLPPPDDGERQADGDIILTASRQLAEAAQSINSSVVRYEHCVVAKMPVRTWAVENTIVVVAVTVIFVLIAAALLLVTYLLARRVFFRRSKLLWYQSSDPLGSSVPKATSRHILYVPENDYFTDSSSSFSSSAEGREETSTNV